MKAICTTHDGYGCGRVYRTISIGHLASKEFSEEKLKPCIYILVKSKDQN